MVGVMQIKQDISRSELLDQRLVLDPLGDDISSIELIRVSGSDIDVVNAARVSFGKMVDEIAARDEKLIEYLMAHKHTSPFEHNQLSFRVKAPIYVARQWMRHRMNSYNEISYRYVKAPLEFYIPLKWRHQDTVNHQATSGEFEDQALFEQYNQALDEAKRVYESLLDAGVGRELARGVLPMCTYTEFIYTCNLHSFIHFLNLRIKKDAQYEIRTYARAMLELAEPFFPISMRVWKALFYSVQEHK